MTAESVTKTAPRYIVPFLVLFLVACATPRPTLLSDDASLHECVAFFAMVDRVVDEAGVRDAEAARIAGFPYLRVDRFLASFRDEVSDGPAFHTWVDRLLALDRAARTVEINNLPRAARDALPRIASPATSIHRCGARLRQAELADPANRTLLRRSAVVPDEYRTAWRVFGLYPLSALFVSRGVGKWQRATHATFRRPLATLEVAGTLTRYVPPRATVPGDVTSLLARAARDPLGIPLLSESELEVLYARHAPVFEIDQAGPADYIGSPRWDGDGLPKVDTDDSTVYRRISFVRTGDQVLLQLNYIIWFPERPRSGAFDILGGRLDGITWRVTLGPDGRPWLYDSMHNCGCYHMFFPSAPLRLRAGLDAQLEPPLVPQPAPALSDGARVVIRIAPGTHYLERVYAAADAIGTGYRFDTIDALRSLPYTNGRRSLYGVDGIVPGTQRAERWLIWPMGIPAPGAMRQWGHHATAFIGRRHFDDPDLLTRLFEGTTR